MTITLCRYHYDPLDRLASSSPADVESIQRFYQKNRLTTEIQGQSRRAIFQTEDHLLAQQQGPAGSALLATDAQRSVRHGLDATQQQAVAYSPYGTRQPHADPLGLLGFNGEIADPVTGHYLLGNGYRAFNPVLMRFNSPDSLSPFGDGGLNAYAYCAGDPVNRVDPTGHTPALIKSVLRALGLMKKSGRTATTSTKTLVSETTKTVKTVSFGPLPPSHADDILKLPADEQIAILNRLNTRLGKTRNKSIAKSVEYAKQFSESGGTNKKIHGKLRASIRTEHNAKMQALEADRLFFKLTGREQDFNISFYRIGVTPEQTLQRYISDYSKKVADIRV